VNDDIDAGREGWLQTVGAWRKDAQLADADESALIRHYDDRQQELATAMESIAAEYKQRLDDDGKASADIWLAEAAADLGRRDGESTRRLFESIP
jgi:patatin-like phospholipase/acyl hydrolase